MPSRIIDQPNVVTLVLPADQGGAVLDHLKAHGAAMGMTEVKTGEGAMTFMLDGWEGGFTISKDYAGLTLRNKN